MTLLSLEVSTSGEARREAAAGNGDGPDGEAPGGSPRAAVPPPPARARRPFPRPIREG